MGLLNACIDMLPRLEAEESIDRASEVAAAWGGEGAQKLLAGWRQQASGDPGEARAKPAAPGDVAGMRIGVLVAPGTAPRSAEWRGAAGGGDERPAGAPAGLAGHITAEGAGQDGGSG